MRSNNRWMTNLPVASTNTPLFRLAIPGSHDSATSNFDPSLGVANNTNVPCACCCCTVGIVDKWSKTQHLSLTEQLQAGIRYFDLRVTLREGTEVRFVHGLYDTIVGEGLLAINAFLNNNPQEVVILDFRSLYNMNPTIHNMLLTDIQNIFGNKLVPSSMSNGLSLQSLWSTPHRVIIIYHDDDSMQTFPNIWPALMIESPWANTNSASQLTQFLSDNYVNRDWNVATSFYVSQGVMTPKTSDVVFGLCSSLEARISNKASQAFVPWLQQTVQQPQHINICIVDFVEKFNFIPAVLSLNQ